jgi:hypothetical protein
MITADIWARLCRTQTACAICRDRDRGRAWRARALALVPGVASDVDFECPLGNPWDYKPTDEAIELRTTENRLAGSHRAASRRAAERLRMCRTCESHGADPQRPCQSCWCKLILGPDGEPDRLAYRLVLAGDRRPPAGCLLLKEGAFGSPEVT